MTGKKALEELIDNGWFEKRDDGWHFLSRPPAKGDINRYTYLIYTLGTYSVGLHGKPAPLLVTRGGDSIDGLTWKVNNKS